MENFPIHHIDTTFGPSRMARYRAGSPDVRCSCNVSTQIWIDLHDDIEQEVRTSGTYHTESEVKKATSIRFMNLYVKDVQTIQPEWSGKEVIAADDLLVTDRGVMTRVGDEYVSAEYEFITKRQEKGSEDRSESSVLRAVMGVMIASEDAEAYFPVHNQSSDGTDKIRHVAHWKRVGNRIKAEMINICGDQPDQTLSDAQKTLEVRIGKEFILHQDSSRAYIFTRGVDESGVHFTQERVEKTKVTQNKIYAIPEYADREDTRERLKSPVQASESHNRASINEMLADTVIHVGNKVLHDTKDTVVSLGAFVLRKTSEQKSKQQIDSTRQDRQIAHHITERIRELFSKSAEDRSHENQPARLTIEKIREKPVRIVEIIKKQHEEMKKGMAILGVIAEMGVAIHAAPVILARLAEKLPTPVVAIKKSIERHAKKELRKKKYELRKTKQETKKDSVKVQPLKTERVEPLRSAKERKARVKRGREKGVPPRRAAGELLTPIVTKGLERREKRRLRRAVEKSMRRHKKKELKRETKKDSVKVQPLIERKRSHVPDGTWRSIQKNERVVIAGARFAWMVWMMLNRANFPSVESKSAMLVSERRDVKLIHPSGVEHESSPWVLLSIIWYLIAIREQGMGNYPIKKKRRKLPKKGIIFAFRS